MIKRIHKDFLAGEMAEETAEKIEQLGRDPAMQAEYNKMAALYLPEEEAF